MCGSSCSANFHLFKKIELLCTKVSIFAKKKKKEHLQLLPRRYFLMARRRRTGTMRQRSDCLVAERRFSAVKSFLVVSGIRLAISCGGGGVVEVE